MEIARTERPGLIELAVAGRLDGYWADHLDAAIADVVREGHDRVEIDLSKTVFLSSAGIAVLVRHHKQLARLNGSLIVSAASEPVALVLEMSRLTAILSPPRTEAAPAAVVSDAGRLVEREGARIEMIELDRAAALTCRIVGDAARLNAPGADQGQEVAIGRSTVALGIGAIGSTFEECRDRFGDLLGVGGAIVYQPADGTNVPDYLVTERGGRSGASAPAPVARLLYGMACEGAFASLARFEPAAGARAIDLPNLAEVLLDESGASSVGVVLIAEVSGLVGAALRQSPFTAAGATAGAGGFFEHPGVRERLTFTAERGFAGDVALVTGIIARPDAPGDHAQLRPIGGTRGLVGHFHAAAFPYMPLRKGRLDLHQTVSDLFESERVRGVLHLLQDDRAASGAGANAFIRGACWLAPITSWT